MEGIQTAQSGDVILTGTRGEQWPLPAAVFAATYDVLEPGRCAKKYLVVTAKRMDTAFDVTPPWSDKPLKGKPGDWRVIYGPGDEGVVDSDIFDETYIIVESDTCTS
ncbi:MAG: hypothetical protein JNL84_13545 [Candidatus Accumulibacter sp.]|nr:hypothetical protein [Accumulibacter sp.]